MSDKRPRWQRHVWMSAAGVVLVLLIAAVVTLGSLTLPIRIEHHLCFQRYLHIYAGRPFRNIRSVLFEPRQPLAMLYPAFGFD